MRARPPVDDRRPHHKGEGRLVYGRRSGVALSPAQQRRSCPRVARNRRMRKFALAIFLALPLVAQPPGIDSAKQKAEILRHFRALVQLDTSNPPGDEIKAVNYLKKVLEAEGIPTKTFALDPNRPSLVARLKGNGSKRPLLILAHTDVVKVQREKWPV